MKRADRIVALVLVGVCTGAWFAARAFSPLSALFPRVIVVILGTLALLLFALSFVSPGKGKVFVLIQGNAGPLALTVVVMAAWVALIGLLGFLVSSVLCFSLMTLVLERRPRRAAPAPAVESSPSRSPLKILLRIALVCALTVAFYLFFDRLLLVSFPRGLLL
jgi:hypothetical protein